MQSSPLTYSPLSRPPTRNELDGPEKSRLLKKARKLSKVFGEVAMLRDMDEDLAARPPPPLPANAAALSSSPIRPSFNVSQADIGKALPDPPRPSLASVDESHISFASSTQENVTEIYVQAPSMENSHESVDTDLVAPSKQSDDCLRRARMAKLSRHFGENIPPEILTDAAASRRPSTPNSIRNARLRKPRRQASIDGLYPAAVASRIKSSSKRTGAHLRRSRSLWGQKPMIDDRPPAASIELGSDDFQARYDESFGEGNRSDHHRALDVRRAKKMRELFGQDPPPELIRVLGNKDDHLLTLTEEERRASIATLLSLSTGTLSTMDLPRSSSAASRLSGDRELPPRPSTAPSRGSSPEMPSFATMRERELAFAALYPRNVRSFDAVDSIRASLDSQDDPVAFQERRRRAAKLSRFFGVGYQDITPSLVSESAAPSSPPPVAAPRSPRRLDADVDVRVTGRNRFWNFNTETKPKQTNVYDVLDKLRKL